MLGEHHDIEHEFPEFHAQLEALSSKDEQFKALVDQHDDLDNRIRRLEEAQLPISDEEIEKMKFRRAALKDQVYNVLRAV